MRSSTRLFGLALAAPALILLLVFFLAPVAFTAVFAFTNMSTATGISGGAHVVTGNLLRDLRAEDVDPETLDVLASASFAVTPQTLRAAERAGVEPRFLAEIEARLGGQSFETAREFHVALRTLPSRPNRVRDLTRASEPFARSILNVRFADRASIKAAISAQAPGAPPKAVEAVASASYTGWRWTTANFATLAERPATARLVLNTVFYVVVTLAFNVLVGLFLAVATFYLPKRGATIFSVLWLLPRITPVVLYALLWKWFTWDNGFLHALATQLGLPAFNYMTGSVPTAWATIILVNGFIGASFGMILFSAALRTIPQQQLWASEVDGANRWQQVRHVILPQLRWPILFVTSYQTLSLLSSYEAIWLTTNGGPGSTTAVWALEAFNVALNNYTGNLQYGLGAAMALVLVVVGTALSLLYLRLFRFRELLTRPRIEF